MGVGGQCHAPAALSPGKTRYPLYWGLGRTQDPSGRMRKISPTPGFDPQTDQPVASRCTDWAIPVPIDCYGTKRSFKFGHPVVFPPNNYTNSCLHILFCIKHDRSQADLRAGWKEDMSLPLTKVPVRRTAPRPTLPNAPVRLALTTSAKQSPPPPPRSTWC